MPSTTIHFPPDVLERIDGVAKRRGISRNRFVIQACEQAVSHDAGEWPDGYFSHGLNSKDVAMLDEATAEMERAMLSNRRNRGAPLL
jgi:predicted transcriptional regulator